MRDKILRTALLAGCMCLFANSVLAKDIVMACSLYADGETHWRYLKYSNPFIGSKQIYNRVDGAWEKWCRPDAEYYKPCELTITNLGSVMYTYFEEKLTKDRPEISRNKGDPIIIRLKYVLDFQFVTRKVEQEEFNLIGDSINSKPYRVDNWDCKLG
jgi:hypothetical protein